MRLRGRSRWLVPASLAILTLGTPGIVGADSNVPPAVTASVSSSDLKEPQTVVAGATFTDPESATETYACTVDCGDEAAVSGTLGRRAEVDAGHPSLPATPTVLFGIWLRIGLN
jgi:hypothetical protein